MAEWWEGDPSERYWMEITGRTDIGTNLNAPGSGEEGAPFWSYDLIHSIRPGDIVFHYSATLQAVVGYSRAVGKPWADQVFWAAKGKSARGKGIKPHIRPGYYLGLENFTPLNPPLEKATIRERRKALFAARDVIAKLHSKPTRFPFNPYTTADLRAFQGYLTKLPAALLDIFPELAPSNHTAVATTATAIKLGQQYRPADEEKSVALRDPFEVDPAIVERGLKGHATTQNALAAYVKAIGGVPLSPAPHDPSYDLAWLIDDTIYVAEVKSCTAKNQEGQLRLGLGQLLRYRALLAGRYQTPVVAVLAAEVRPSDLTWENLCTELGVQLVWPDKMLAILAAE